MYEIEKVGKSISVPLQTDEDGYTGRECPTCEGYFKVTFGTGLKGNVPCHCPYCGHVEDHGHFWTQGQIDYAKSISLRKITNALHKDLKKMEFDIKPKGAFGIGMSLKFSGGRLPPVRYYREKRLETAIVCDSCTLRYMIYGVFAFCPDCGSHNSGQILGKNLDLVEKQLGLAAQVDAELGAHLIGDGLENAVSSFDGFGREACKVFAAKASDPAKAEGVSFQNLAGAQKNLNQLYGIDLSSGLPAVEWEFVCCCFQKRHLLAHKMGIVDEAYLRTTGDRQAVLGRKVVITEEEVGKLLGFLRTLTTHLLGQFRAMP